MLERIKNWQRNRILRHEGVPEQLWQKLIHLRCLKGFSVDELSYLRDCVTLFLHAKQINGAHELEITDEMRVVIAIQACILVLKLDLDYYENWIEIIVYPDDFIRDFNFADSAGIVHHVHTTASGESWLAGPVILSWRDITHAADHPGHNVVIHEFAHKIDMLNDGANGCPELHPNMNTHTWYEIFSQAYHKFCQQVEYGHGLIIDPYAAESPAEFFAVLSEVFFELPLIIKHHFPLIYEQLALFYRQDPAQRWEKTNPNNKLPRPEQK